MTRTQRLKLAKAAREKETAVPEGTAARVGASVKTTCPARTDSTKPRRTSSVKPHDPDAEYAKLDDWTKQEARRHADADMDTGKRGWLCQCGACRLVRIALYDGAGNAVRP